MHEHHGANCPHSTAKINDKNKKITFSVMLLTGVFMLVEFIGGYLSNSLALIADAGHMLTDFAALFLAYYAFHLSSKPVDIKRTFGYHRFQVLASFINGIAIIALSLWIFKEAVFRFINPVEVMSQQMLIIAAVGLGVNIIALKMLHKANPKSLNIQGAKLHVIGDLLGSVAAIASAIIIYFTGWMQIDAILSVLVAVILLKSAWIITRRSVNILLESTPDEICQNLIKKELLNKVSEITNIHHMHIWSLNSEIVLSSMHVVVNKEHNINNDALISKITAILKNDYHINHVTIQVEFEICKSTKDDLEAI